MIERLSQSIHNFIHDDNTPILFFVTVLAIIAIKLRLKGDRQERPIDLDEWEDWND